MLQLLHQVLNACRCLISDFVLDISSSDFMKTTDSPRQGTLVYKKWMMDDICSPLGNKKCCAKHQIYSNLAFLNNCHQIMVMTLISHGGPNPYHDHSKSLLSAKSAPWEFEKLKNT